MAREQLYITVIKLRIVKFITKVYRDGSIASPHSQQTYQQNQLHSTTPPTHHPQNHPPNAALHYVNHLHRHPINVLNHLLLTQINRLLRTVSSLPDILHLSNILHDPPHRHILKLQGITATIRPIIKSITPGQYQTAVECHILCQLLCLLDCAAVLSGV